jgi:hypothetical protein
MEQKETSETRISSTKVQHLLRKPRDLAIYGVKGKFGDPQTRSWRLIIMQM